MSDLLYAGPWSGGVTDQSAIVKASVSRTVTTASLEVATDDQFQQAQIFQPQSLWEDSSRKYVHKIASFAVDGLQPNQRYLYRLILNGAPDGLPGAFRTFPPHRTRQDFKIAFASCSGNKRIFNLRYPMPESYIAIRTEPDILLFLHLGDLHYANIKKPELAVRLEQYDWILRRPEPGNLFRSHAMAYCWDDHDFLGDDRDGGDPKYKEASIYARDAYDVYIPHYPFDGDGSDGIYQSFELGNVLFLMTDNRFNKFHRGSDTSPRSMLGVKQNAWLKSQLLRGKSYDLIVWGNSLPWIGEAHPRLLFWAGYSDERKSISEFLIENEIRNLCMLSGDAHMLAIDDGSNTGYAANGAGGFPLFHAAAIESRPTRKGGLYSLGTRDGRPGKGIAGTGQYGVMEVRYPQSSDGTISGPPRVYWTGKRVRRRSSRADDFDTRTLLQYDFPADSASARTGNPR